MKRHNARERHGPLPACRPAPINIEQTIANKTPTPEAAIIRHELRLLDKALAALPERTRIALEMRQLGGHTLKEIADHIGLSVTQTHAIITAGVAHCHRARPER